jgi:hypothetical protein
MPNDVGWDQQLGPQIKEKPITTSFCPSLVDIRFPNTLLLFPLWTTSGFPSTLLLFPLWTFGFPNTLLLFQLEQLVSKLFLLTYASSCNLKHTLYSFDI